MNKIKSIFAVAFILLMAANFPVYANEKIDDRLVSSLKTQPSDSAVKVWIYFADKNISVAKSATLNDLFAVKCLDRRQNIPLDMRDLPVSEEYIRQIKDAGGYNVRASRWLNAVSAFLTPSEIQVVSSLKCVKSIAKVVESRRAPIPEAFPIHPKPLFDESIYGASLTQNRMLKTDSAHTLGYSGSGVLIAFLDTGFDTSHVAFDSMTILATWDFINDDDDVDDFFPTATQVNHGTATLSACGGFVSGQLIGTAYGADYILAKTENVPLEIRAEEDNWVLAAEWADSIGADIISTSLGYTDWYTVDSMDGNTSVTTIAADIAASRGILVVVSAGNDGNNSSWRIISAPADADSVVAVGAVDAGGAPASFTSYGPTADGRIKPEVSALGVRTYSANANGGFSFVSGTSLSAPLISGAAALILESNPHLRGNPMAIRQRLIEAGHLFPDSDSGNRLGYGIPNVIEAMHVFQIAIIPPIYISPDSDTSIIIETLNNDGMSVSFAADSLPSGYSLVNNNDGSATLNITGDASLAGAKSYLITAIADSVTASLTLVIVMVDSSESFFVGPNPFKNNLIVSTTQSFPSGYTIDIFSLSGELVYQNRVFSSEFNWPAVNSDGKKIASGVYIIRISAEGIDKKVKLLKL
ncbi:MAG: S8 family peptidase [candidate division Zixibacteria bacterium]|nr:S8 family peptidase [candidate division Zixibacteria bacterium]